MTLSFPLHTIESAPEATRPSLAKAARAFGAVPAALALLAESPQVVEAFDRLQAIYAASTLTPLEREVVTMTVARANGCELCIVIHSRILLRMGASSELVAALVDGQPLADAKLEALRRFTMSALERRGDVGDAERDAFATAGFEARHALDVVLGIATYTLSTYGNRLTRAPIDVPGASHPASQPGHVDPSIHTANG